MQSEFVSNGNGTFFKPEQTILLFLYYILHVVLFFCLISHSSCKANVTPNAGLLDQYSFLYLVKNILPYPIIVWVVFLPPACMTAHTSAFLIKQEVDLWWLLHYDSKMTLEIIKIDGQ